jgi:hypothetical protein
LSIHLFIVEIATFKWSSMQLNKTSEQAIASIVYNDIDTL